jgi:hypothetical protein
VAKSERTKKAGPELFDDREGSEPADIVPDGRQLVTLRDAGNYITKLPKAEHEAQEWQAAMEALILVATQCGAKALNRRHVREFNPKQKEPHWGRCKLARDR